MKRVEFIADNAGRFIAASLGRVERGGKVDIDKCIDMAIKLYERLEQRGIINEPKEGKLKAGKDYYAMLNDHQRGWFNKFWPAFGYKQGRDGAAKVWYRMGDLPDAVYELIVWAAGQEASRRKQHPDKTPIMAEGWLSQYRYKDYIESMPEVAATGGAVAISQEENALLEQVKAAAGDMAYWKSKLSEGDPVLQSAMNKWKSLTGQLQAMQASRKTGRVAANDESVNARAMVLRFSIRGNA